MLKTSRCTFIYSYSIDDTLSVSCSHYSIDDPFADVLALSVFDIREWLFWYILVRMLAYLAGKCGVSKSFSSNI